MIDLLPLSNVQVVAVCDPNKDSDNYVDWSRDGLGSGHHQRDRAKLGLARAGTRGVPGGRDVTREMVEIVLREPTRRGEIHRLPAMPISASCSKRKKTWTP